MVACNMQLIKNPRKGRVIALWQKIVQVASSIESLLMIASKMGKPFMYANIFAVIVATAKVRRSN